MRFITWVSVEHEESEKYLCLATLIGAGPGAGPGRGAGPGPGAGEAPGQVWQAATLQVEQQQVGSLLWAQVEAQVWPQKQASFEVVFTEGAKGLAVATATTKRSLNMLPQGE